LLLFALKIENAIIDSGSIQENNIAIEILIFLVIDDILFVSENQIFILKSFSFLAQSRNLFNRISGLLLDFS
jgi:hypothetical protein